MAVALTKALLTEQMRSDEVPGREDAQAKLAHELQARVGVEMLVEDVPDLVHYGMVDDYYASFEWSEGGMIHAHIAFWIVGAPRIDKIEVPREKADASTARRWVEIDVVPDESLVAPHTAAAD